MNMIRLVRGIRDDIRYEIDGYTGIPFEQFMVAHGDVGNLCTKFDDEGCPTAEGIEEASRFIARARNWTPMGWKLYRLYCIAKMIGNLIVCEVKGHDLVDDSYGGPDSGCMAAHCSRCGWGFHHQLY